MSPLPESFKALWADEKTYRDLLATLQTLGPEQLSGDEDDLEADAP